MDARFKLWLEAKNNELKRKELRLKRQAEIKLKNELRKRLEIQEKCKDAYNLWLRDKIKDEKGLSLLNYVRCYRREVIHELFYTL